MNRLVNLALLSTALVFAACRGSDSKGDDTPNPDGPPGGSVKVKDVQNDMMAKGTAVELHGVIVTAIDAFGDRTGDLWVEDAEGGAYSGVKVFGTPLDQIAALAVGDIIDITNAEKDEFALTTDTSGRTVTELKGAGGGMLTVTKKGTGTVPAAEVVDAKAISMMPQAMQDAEWEKWEGVLIKVINAKQESGVKPFGAGAVDQQSFDITGNVTVETVMAAFPASAGIDVCYAGLTGIGDYFFDYLLLPRNTSELETGGNGCVATQNATIAEVQAGTKTGPVVVDNVFVVAVSFNKKNLWVASSLTAAANEGVYVFRGTAASTPVLPVEIVPGAKVKVNGSVKEQNNDTTGDTVTQLESATVTFIAAPTATPTPVTGQLAATLTQNATGEPYESVLVTLTNVKVNTVGDTASFGVGQLQQGATTFLSDDDIFRILAADLNKCYASITGVWTYQVFDNTYGFLPLAAGTGTGTCP